MEHSIKVPQLGEAIQSVNIIRYLKSVGDHVSLDEPIVTLETDKAALDIESPVAGVVSDLIFPEGATVAVGKTIIVISETDVKPSEDVVKSKKLRNSEYQPVADLNHLKKWLEAQRNGVLSPREKAYCLNNKVIPMSLYKDFSNGKRDQNESIKLIQNANFVDKEVQASQLSLNQTLSTSATKVVTANLQVLCDNTSIENFRRARRQANDAVIPSRLELISWAVVKAMDKHPTFRSRLINANQLREFKDTKIGIAVAMSGDELLTAVVNRSSSDGFYDFIRAMRVALEEVRQDGYVTTYHSLSISDMSSFDMINAIPVVAFPAMATLFIGKPHGIASSNNQYYLSLSFDHRIVNGAGAAHFLNEVKRQLRDPGHFIAA